ncbi:MAG: N-acetyltransferase [Streptosporangiales bacterium]|nr:N-acetyltransferase [Streptosporangiales bacterium]
MLIRRETDRDIDGIRAVTIAAFTRPRREGGAVPEGQVPAEAPLVEALRDSDAWLPRLSLVATGTGDDDIIGHVVCSRAHVGEVPVLALGPISVHPDQQARGVGSALMHAVLGAADALGEPLVGLLGDPRYYRWFGFRPCAAHGIVPPDPGWREHFQVRALTRCLSDLRGAFRYAAAFDRV